MFRRWLILAALTALSGSIQVAAQVPTAEQLELLRSMNPEDRAALMEQLGVDRGAVTDSTMQGAFDERGTRTRDGASPKTPDALCLAKDAADSIIKPGDSLLIELDFKK